MRCRVTQSPEEAAEALRQGKLVALPTETVYGLGANALDARAVAGIFAAKERPAFDPLIVHVPDVDSVSQVAREFPPLARRLVDRFWPGPLTLVLPKTDIVPELVTSGLATVAVRVPRHPLIRRVLELTDFPVAAPSANLFGRLSPTTVEHVLDQLGDRIDLVLDGGPCQVGVESTIVQVSEGQVVVLRPGGTSLEMIEQITNRIAFAAPCLDTVPLAPGQLPSHYAPRTPLELVDSIPTSAPSAGCGLLLFQPFSTTGYAQLEILSASGSMEEAAANFFPSLHRLDAAGLQVILTTRFPESGLGRALNDRLERAAKSRIDLTKSR